MFKQTSGPPRSISTSVIGAFQQTHAIAKATEPTLCTHFLGAGCKNGNDCSFFHDEGEKQRLEAKRMFKQTSGPPRSISTPVKGTFQQTHVVAKAPETPIKPSSKTLCSFFLQGKCKKGDGCPFSHNDITNDFANMKM